MTVHAGNLIEGTSIGSCTYRLSSAGNFDEVREECKSYGGDLIHKQFVSHDAVVQLLVCCAKNKGKVTFLQQKKVSRCVLLSFKNKKMFNFFQVLLFKYIQ